MRERDRERETWRMECKQKEASQFGPSPPDPLLALVPVIFRIEGTEREPRGLCEVLLRSDWASSPEGCFVAETSDGDVISE